MPLHRWVLCLFVVNLGCSDPPAAQAELPTAAPAAPAGPADLKKLQDRVRQAADEVRPAIVAVEQAWRTGEAGPKHHLPLASGVIINPEGLILSQYHVTHMSDPVDFEKSRKPGERLKVILSDGTPLEAELLEADRTADLSLLRITKPGKYPHAALDPAATVGLGDWVMKLGHPMGYRPDRLPVVRLGRVVSRHDDSFIPDCAMTAGDSGGPLFDLDGRLVGVVRNPAGIDALDAQDALAGGVQLNACSSASLIASCMAAILKKELAALDGEKFRRMVEGLRQAKTLPTAEWTQGVDVRG